MQKTNKLLFSFWNLREKLKISFYLTVVLPILICVYLVSDYLFPIAGVSSYMMCILVFLNLFIAVIGFLVAREAFNQVLVENENLTCRMEKLEINDAVTGLYNDSFIRNRLQEEIRRSIMHQRPCAFILLRIEHFDAYLKKFGLTQSENLLRDIASLIRKMVTEIDPVGRMQDNLFAVILAERNKRQAQRIAEEISGQLELSSSKGQDLHKRFTVSTGVSENPLDGVDAGELIIKAQEALGKI